MNEEVTTIIAQSHYFGHLEISGKRHEITEIKVSFHADGEISATAILTPDVSAIQAGSPVTIHHMGIQLKMNTDLVGCCTKQQSASHLHLRVADDHAKKHLIGWIQSLASRLT